MQISSAKSRSFCPGGDELTIQSLVTYSTVNQVIMCSGNGLLPIKRQVMNNVDLLPNQPEEQNSVKFELKYKNHISLNYICQCRLASFDIFIPVLTTTGCV